MISAFTDLVNYLGLGPDKIVPFLMLGFFIVVAMDKKINPLSKSIRRITNSIIEIQTIFKNSGNPLDHLLTEAPGSPLRPTEHGTTLIKESGLEGILDENKESLLKKLSQSLPKNYTEYDVQEKAREVLVGLRDDQLMNEVKEYAYKIGIEVEIILRTGGLWLRDDFLKQPRNIAKKV